MKNLNELVKDIERDLVINLVIGVRHRRISMKEAKAISRSFMASFPFQDSESLFDQLYVLSNKYRTARKVYIKYAPDFYERKTQEQIAKVRKSYG